jgi:hypothetical protein
MIINSSYFLHLTFYNRTINKLQLTVLSLSPHKLSHCCHVPVLGNGNGKQSTCSNCKQPCNVVRVDDGEREYRVKMMQVKQHSIDEVTKQVIVTGYNHLEEKITVEFTDRRGEHSYCIINNNDFFKWASANSYLALLPETQYVDGNHWDKQPHHINRRLNKAERARFYNSIDKPMLEHYLNEKIQQHYATAV